VPAVWNSLPKTVLSSDSVAVFKSRLKTFFFPRLSLSLLTNTLPGPSASGYDLMSIYKSVYYYYYFFCTLGSIDPEG